MEPRLEVELKRNAEAKFMWENRKASQIQS